MDTFFQPVSHTLGPRDESSTSYPNHLQSAHTSISRDTICWNSPWQMVSSWDTANKNHLNHQVCSDCPVIHVLIPIKILLTKQKAQEEIGMKGLIQIDAGTQRTLSSVWDLTPCWPGLLTDIGNSSHEINASQQWKYKYVKEVDKSKSWKLLNYIFSTVLLKEE